MKKLIILITVSLVPLPSIAETLIESVPSSRSIPGVPSSNTNYGGLIDEANFWLNLKNTKKQLAKLEASRTKIANSLPKGTKQKYDIVVQGNKFLYHVPHGADLLVGGRELPRLYTVEIEGTLETHTPSPKLNKKEVRDFQHDRDSQRIRSEIERFKREGDNYRAPAM